MQWWFSEPVVQTAAQLPAAPVVWNYDPPTVDGRRRPYGQGCNIWKLDALKDLAVYYREFGIGLFAYRALRWQSGQLGGHSPPRIQSNLAQLDRLWILKRDALLKNTEFFTCRLPSAACVALRQSRLRQIFSLVKVVLRAQRIAIFVSSKSPNLTCYSTKHCRTAARRSGRSFIIFVDDLRLRKMTMPLKPVVLRELTARPQRFSCHF